MIKFLPSCDDDHDGDVTDEHDGEGEHAETHVHEHVVDHPLNMQPGKIQVFRSGV